MTKDHFGDDASQFESTARCLEAESVRAFGAPQLAESGEDAARVARAEGE